ncbi:PIN domain-containing protein [Candidatus Entotheonella palauensis]|uniref:PIN domain-containing protein n=1 Tax=Candidatus Entotheonella palauensis TaxID=93172 RepID=UPI000B7FA56C|nr:PIN domain-containing protein [Candidatus Entotheonella palauensis]
MAKQLVLDANILMRGVLGTRVAMLIRDYAADVDLLTVEEAFEDVATYLPEVLARRGNDEQDIQAALTKLASLRYFLQIMPVSLFEPLERRARERLKGRDEDDWPYLALALVLECPIRTEDTDFFGCGVPIWTTDRVEL